jgi:hypothetical protein
MIKNDFSLNYSMEFQENNSITVAKINKSKIFNSFKMKHFLALFVLLTSLSVPLYYGLKSMAKDEFLNLNYIASGMVYKEEGKKRNISIYSSGIINPFNYTRLKARYNQIINAMNTKESSEIYNCISSKGVFCENVNLIKENGHSIIVFDDGLSEDAIKYILEASMSRRIIHEYYYGKNKITFKWS